MWINATVRKPDTSRFVFVRQGHSLGISKWLDFDNRWGTINSWEAEKPIHEVEYWMDIAHVFDFPISPYPVLATLHEYVIVFERYSGIEKESAVIIFRFPLVTDYNLEEFEKMMWQSLWKHPRSANRAGFSSWIQITNNYKEAMIK